MKGISAVIVILILLIITVSMVGLVMLFLGNVQQKTVESAQENAETFTGQAIPFAIESVDGTAVYVRNMGTKSIENISLVFYVDNQRMEIETDNVTPGALSRINLSEGVLAAGTYSFKLSSTLTEAAETKEVPRSNLLREPTFQDFPRGPASIMLVIDRSGSMDDDCPGGQANPGETPCKINDAKSAATMFVDMTEDTDAVGLVSFANTATVNQQLTLNKTLVKNAINTLNALGGTGIGHGIRNATFQLMADTSGRRKIQVMLTDGNESMNSNPMGAATDAASKGIKIYTIGLGADVDENQLKAIANVTKGKYYFAPSGAQLASIFADIGSEIGVSWVKLGNTTIEPYGDVCLSPDKCANFTAGVYPTTALYQDVRIVFPDTYSVKASVQAKVSGAVCNNQCSQMPGQTCADNDARLHLFAMDSSGTVLGEVNSSWGSTKGMGWVLIEQSWTTPTNTKKVRLQIDAGDCCSTCSATGVYVDNTNVEIAKP